MANNLTTNNLPLVDLCGLIWPDVAMKQVKIADLKNQLSQHLRAVERGAEIEVTDRNRPIVRLVPARAAESQIRIIPAKRPFAEVRNKRYPKARWGGGSLKLLLEERGKR
jgi:prevent-host-death family protein